VIQACRDSDLRAARFLGWGMDKFLRFQR
jgi:hypothetical protein